MCDRVDICVEDQESLQGDAARIHGVVLCWTTDTATELTGF